MKLNSFCKAKEAVKWMKREVIKQERISVNCISDRGLISRTQRQLFLKMNFSMEKLRSGKQLNTIPQKCLLA